MVILLTIGSSALAYHFTAKLQWTIIVGLFVFVLLGTPLLDLLGRNHLSPGESDRGDENNL